MQRYSIENQRDAMEAYAAQRGYTVVRNYIDAGKSGLHFRSRKGLKALIVDVTAGQADFDRILVYDVSRWGRFQDTDESAHYEFLCRQQGIGIEYCAEQFQNDGSLTATLLKNIKRAMAGEYSRELSVKVFIGQSKIASNGFHVGSTPGFGLRRHLVDETRRPKGELAFGERKSIKSDRVILVPGPPDEVEIVRYVYSMFVDGKCSFNAIARALNEQKISNAGGRPWTGISIRELIANEKYAGACLYARTQKKLGINWRRNPPQEWVRKPGAFAPVVSSDQFAQAQAQWRDNLTPYTDAELLDSLTAVWCKAGTLTREVIDGAETGPSSHTIRNRFGSIGKAYETVGFRRPDIANRTINLGVRNEIRQSIADRVRKQGGKVITSKGCRLLINGHLKVTVVVGRTPLSSPYNQWRFGYRSKIKPDILIVARIQDDSKSAIKDFYVLPFLFLPHGSWLTVSGLNYRRLESFRKESLDSSLDLWEAARLETLNDA
jgi:DNA invertase Pin-like site-specific DNA recombinase